MANSERSVHRITKDDLVLLVSYKTKEELLSKLNRTGFGFERFLKNREYFISNDNIDCKVLAAIIQIISDVCTISIDRYKGSLLRFLQMLKECKQFIFEDILLAIHILLSKRQPSNLVLFLSQYLIILHTLMRYFACQEIIEYVFPAIQSIINSMNTQKLRDLDDVKINFDLLKRRIDKCDFSSTNQSSEDLDTIRKFCDLSIVPKENDITNCEIPNLPHNIVDAPYEDVDHYLGVHFLLTREDMLRSFRECVKICLGNDELAKSRSSNRLYPNVSAKLPAKYKVKGICYNIVIQSIQNGKKERDLKPGTLVCLTPDNFRKVIFATVLELIKGEKAEIIFEIMLADDLYEDELLPDVKYLMVEPSAYFECYKHVLTSIKSFTPKSFPLADILVYFDNDETSPEYLRDSELLRGKTYCLSIKIEDENAEDASCSTKEFNPLNYEEWPTAKELELDDQQHKAFQLALTKKVAVIQGPPGTGKTFIGKKVVKALLDNVPITPIVICCLTNHALDQFLEGMQEHTKNIVRLGSQSKSDNLAPYRIDNLIYTKNCYKENRTENYLSTDKTARMALKYLQTFVPHLLESKASGERNLEFDEFKSVCDNLNDLLNTLYFCEFNYLEETALYKIIDEKYKEQLISGSKTRGDLLTTFMLEWLASSRKSDLYTECKKRFSTLKGKMSSFVTLNKNLKLWSLNLTDRFEQFYIWRGKAITVLKRNISRELDEYKEMKRKKIRSLTDSDRIEILKKAKIIGVTTTGAAKYRDLIAFASPCILIVEEAAEVLESHIIASLLPTIKHMILIGDHKQLRPLPASNELSEIYNLKISMFERLFNNKAPSATLVYQHRMKPCIAKLLVNEFLYDDLQSYKNVYEYEEIKGMKSSVFFLNHSETESENSSSTSSSNKYEAEMIVGLTKYLLNQSYKSDQITILATYAAQVNLLEKYLEDANIEVKLTTVDNYQGEENDIIILSFVRNNKSGIIGFLKEDNRVCVALSRARKGMYCLGNFTMYAGKSKLWSNIATKLEAQNMIGDKFPLHCSRHGSETHVQTPTDILEFIEAGCRKPCNYMLPCGHTCTRKCHFYDTDHLKYQCKNPCEKYIDENRKCPRLCFERCKRIKRNLIELDCGHKARPINSNSNPICIEEVPKYLPCKHLVTLPCSTDISQYLCKAIETVRLSCGHQKKIPCYKKDKLDFVICNEKRPLFSPCGHTVDVECNLNLEGNDLLAYCTKTCDVLLKCGHLCIAYCRFCFDFGIHALCTAKCDKKLLCGHECKGHCDSPCPPCREVCGLICPHNDPKSSKCINSCYRPCVECHKPCKIRCAHVTCTKLCFEKCDVEPCSKPCEEILPCGHKCIGLCGDPCPYLCRVCNECDIESGDSKKDRYVMLDNCDHVVEVHKLTEHIEKCLLLKQWPSCPVCSSLIFLSLRYKNQLLKAKEVVLKSRNTAEMISDIKFLLHTAFEDDYAPYNFQDVHCKIVNILQQENPTIDILSVLKPSVVNLSRLVNIYKKLENCAETAFKKRVMDRFETVLLWLGNHLKFASYQQLSEAGVCIDDLEKLAENVVKYVID